MKPLHRFVGFAIVALLAVPMADAGDFTIRSCSLSATLSEGKKGAVVSLVNADGYEFMAEPTELFGVALTDASNFTNRLVVSSAEAGSVAFNGDEKKLEAVFTGFPAGLEQVTVRMTGDDRLRWRIDVKTREGWVLEEAMCPRVVLKAVWDGDRDERITTGHSNAGCYRPLDELRKNGFLTAERPGRMSMQYAGAFNRRHGFYTAAEDPENESKYLRIVPLRRGTSTNYAETVKGIRWEWSWRCWEPKGAAQPYDVVMRGLIGSSKSPLDWRDIADIYREWVMPQKWCAEPIAHRPDLPEWMKSGPAKTFFKRCWIADPDEIRRWMNEYYRPAFGDLPLVVSFWGWEHQDLWVGPGYFPAFPSDEAFKSLTADLKRMNAHTFLWPSGFRWLTLFDRKGDGTFDYDDTARWNAEAHPHAVLERDGREHEKDKAVWWRGGTNKQLCGADPWSVDWFVDNAKKMVELGAESIQVDQQGGGYLNPCYAANHGHAPGEGVWKVRAFTKFLERLRDELKPLSPDLVLGMEAPGDCYNRFWGIQDHRDCESFHAAEWASTFNWLYHEYVPTFQSNMFMRRFDRPVVAHCAVDGQLPFPVPSRGDYAKGESVIWNSGFEKTAPNGEFAGWERLRGCYRNEEQSTKDYYSMSVLWTGRAYPDRSEAKDGKQSVRLETLNAEDVVCLSQDIFTDDAAFVPGKTYRLSAWVKTEVSDQPERNYMEVQVFDEGQRIHVGMPRTVFPKDGEGWKRISADFVWPEKAHMFRPLFFAGGKAVVRVDGVMLERVEEGGSTSPVVWTGKSSHRLFVEKWVRLYHGEGRRFLAHGRQIRGPEVICKTFHYKADCHVNLIYNGHPNSGGADDEAMPVVASQAFQSEDGAKALFLANATAVPQRVTYRWLGQETSLEIAPDDLMMIPLPEEKIVQRHDYFTDEALSTADMDGVAAETAAALAKCEAAFANAEELLRKLTNHDREQIRCRLEMARRLRDYVTKRAAAPERDEQILAWQGAMELEAFFDYFHRMAKRVAEKASAPPPKVFDVRDFGAKGDGMADDSAAFRAAFEAVRKLNGAPSVIRVPVGTYRILAEEHPAASFSCHDFQNGDDRGVVPIRNGEYARTHLLMTNLRNVVLRGEGEGSVLAFADATKGGIRVYGCCDVSVEDLAMDYCENPSTQGTVVKVESDPFALVLKRDAGYPDPDSPRFVNATSRYFSPVGENRMYLPGGVARMGTVERLGTDLFRLVPYAHHRDNGVWRSCRAGSRICIMARYDSSTGGGPLRFIFSAFCAARNLRVFDSPGQVFSQPSSYATSVIGCRVIGRDGSDDIVSSNADGFLGGGQIGPYISDCEFSGLEDDGTNISTNTGELPSIPESGRLSQSRTTGAQPAKGGLLIDGVTGLCKMFVRYGTDDVATRPLPADAVPASAVRKVSDKDRRKFDFNTAQKKGVNRADRLIRIPGTVGGVIRNTTYSRLRGRGIQVHCGNMLVENVRVSDVTGMGISVNALLPWGMCYDVHNIYVRNCVFERLGAVGANLAPNPLVAGEPLRQRMHFGIEFENCVFRPPKGNPAVKVANNDDVRFVNCTFRTEGVKEPVQVVNSTRVKIEEERADVPADRLSWTRWWAKPGYWQRRIDGAKADIAAGTGEYDIVFCGDSNTQNREGWRAEEDVENLRHWIAKGRITEERAFIGPRREWLELQKRYRVLNLGISGDCTQHLLWRLTKGGLLDGYRARYFCVLIGANNCYHDDGAGEPENIVAGVRAIIAAIQAKHPESKVILHRLTPSDRKANDPVEVRHERAAALLPALADGKRVIFCDFTAPLREQDGSQAKRFFADGLHLNEDGFRVWSAAVRAIVDSDGTS